VRKSSKSIWRHSVRNENKDRSLGAIEGSPFSVKILSMLFLDKPCYVRMRNSEILPGQLLLGPMPRTYPGGGVTHILSCMANSSTEKLVKGSSIIVHTMPMLDIEDYAISQFFPEACAFIESAIQSGGVILVHCMVGVSRSATIVAAYLMWKNKISSFDAVLFIRKIRNCVRPNQGFLQQLVLWEEQCRTFAPVVSS